MEYDIRAEAKSFICFLAEAKLKEVNKGSLPE